MIPIDAPIGPIVMGALVAGALALLGFFIKKSFTDFADKLDTIAAGFAAHDKTIALIEQRIANDAAFSRQRLESESDAASQRCEELSATVSELAARLSRVEGLVLHLDRREA